MRVIVQRVRRAQVDVEGRVVSAIEKGLLLLVGFEAADTSADLTWMSGKLTKLRIFDDENGVMNRNIREEGGQILAVSQFTLFAAVKKGLRPSWHRAAPPTISRPLFEAFVKQLETDLGEPVLQGVFGAEMQIALVNDGPVSLFIDSKNVE